MQKKDRNQLISKMSYRDLLMNLFASQLLFVTLGIGLSYLLFDSLTEWTELISWSPREFILFGFLPGIAVVILDLLLMKVMPEEQYDDGGLNTRLFTEAPVIHIFFIALIVAVCEEILFRGLLQTTFGIYVASFLFAFMHFRYIRKPVLFFFVLILSFSLGFLYMWTGNLLVPIVMHFTIDFTLGLIIHMKKKHQG